MIGKGIPRQSAFHLEEEEEEEEDPPPHTHDVLHPRPPPNHYPCFPLHYPRFSPFQPRCCGKKHPHHHH